jgi:hypothetical protein
MKPTLQINLTDEQWAQIEYLLINSRPPSDLSVKEVNIIINYMSSQVAKQFSDRTTTTTTTTIKPE